MTRPAHDHEVRSEQVLARQLSAPQQIMMALGGAIGTGLFLASGLAVNVAGPAVILSYAIVAAVALLLGAALTEMAVAHPTAGAFGVYAGMYVSPFAGYAVRVSYWLMEVIATGGQLVAASIYMSYWFPAVPGALWVLVFAIALIYVNSREVGELGAVEYWLVMIKVVAIVLFVALGVLVLAGATGGPAIGLANVTNQGGFMPFGLTGVWLACCFVIYSFIGVEIVGVTSGEASDPARTIPRAMRRMVAGLSLIYIVTATLLIALTPWNQLGIGESPFVSVLRRMAIPGAAGVMNAVVLLAALSSANANFYLIARTLFSLARAGFVPQRLRSRRRGARTRILAAVGLRVVLRRRALRRAVRVADDLRDAHRVPRPERADRLVCRRRPHRRDARLHLVGAGPSIDGRGRRAVDAPARDRLPRVVGKTPRGGKCAKMISGFE